MTEQRQGRERLGPPGDRQEPLDHDKWRQEEPPHRHRSRTMLPRNHRNRHDHRDKGF